MARNNGIDIGEDLLATIGCLIGLVLTAFGILTSLLIPAGVLWLMWCAGQWILHHMG